jgi:type II secretion system protein N
MAEVRRGFPFFEKIGIAAFCSVCLIFFVSIRFPYDTFRGTLEQSLSRAIDQPVALGHVHARFPFGCRVDGMSVGKIPYAKELIIYPHLFSLLTGSLGMDVKAVFPTGSLACSFDKPLGIAKKPVRASFKMVNFDTALLHTLFSTSMQPKGFITGSIEMAGTSPSIRDMGGKASIVWKDGFIPLTDSQLPIDGLRFKVMQMDSRIENGLLTLEKMDLKGDVSGSVKGAVRMMDPLRRSRLSLSGEIALSQGMVTSMGAGAGFSPQGMVRFSLRGTLDRPRFRILGSPR